MTRFRIPYPAKVPEEFKSWSSCFKDGVWGLWLVPYEAKIRAALDQKCERCGGKGFLVFTRNAFGGSECLDCRQSGLRQIPGVERM